MLVEPNRGLVELYFRAEVLDAAIKALEARDAKTIRVDVGGKKVNALDRFADALKFPEHFGHNLDAFADCMFDVASGDYGFGRKVEIGVLAVYQFDAVVKANPKRAHQIVEILYDSAVTALKQGRALLIMLQTDDPDLVLQPVRHEIEWNRTEWARSARKH